MTSVALATAVTASTQSHDAQVAQTTSGLLLIRADGARGYFTHRRGIRRAPTTLFLGGAIVYLEASARISALQRSVIGPSIDEPVARISGLSRSVVGPAVPPAQAARLTAIYRTVIGPPREATFENAQLTVGLTWLELTRPSDMS